MPETLAMTELWLHKKGEEGGGRERGEGRGEQSLSSRQVSSFSSAREWRCAGASEREREREGGQRGRSVSWRAQRMRDGEIAAAQQ